MKRPDAGSQARRERVSPARDRRTRLFLAVSSLILVACRSDHGGRAISPVNAARHPFSLEGMSSLVSLTDGRHLEARCLGRGRPTVVFENGLGMRYDSWLKVAARLGTKTSVCVYNRAGIGASDLARLPRTSGDMAADLKELLRGVSAPTPYILVGHSIGGFVVRVFADRHPNFVAAAIFIDSAHPDQAAAFERLLPPRDADTAPVRAFRNEEVDGWMDRKNPEGMDLSASATEVRATTVPLAFPVRVISAGRVTNPFGLPVLLNAEIGNTWNVLQVSLTKLSRDGARRVSPTAAHFVQDDDPDFIVDEIDDLIHQSRRREPRGEESDRVERVDSAAP
jgi:pimeloyl-ACP methyl ester carboxylesterase